MSLPSATYEVLRVGIQGIPLFLIKVGFFINMLSIPSYCNLVAFMYSIIHSLHSEKFPAKK